MIFYLQQRIAFTRIKKARIYFYSSHPVKSFLLHNMFLHWSILQKHLSTQYRLHETKQLRVAVYPHDWITKSTIYWRHNYARTKGNSAFISECTSPCARRARTNKNSLKEQTMYCTTKRILLKKHNISTGILQNWSGLASITIIFWFLI